MASNNFYTDDCMIGRYLGKDVYYTSSFTSWSWPRKVRAVRFKESSGDKNTIIMQVKIRNLFWYDWVNVDNVRLVSKEREL